MLIPSPQHAKPTQGKPPRDIHPPLKRKLSVREHKQEHTAIQPIYTCAGAANPAAARKYPPAPSSSFYIFVCILCISFAYLRLGTGGRSGCTDGSIPVGAVVIRAVSPAIQALVFRHGLRCCGLGLDAYPNRALDLHLLSAEYRQTAERISI